MAVPVLVLQQRFLNWVSVSPEIAPRKTRHKAAQRVGRSPGRSPGQVARAGRHGEVLKTPFRPTVMHGL